MRNCFVLCCLILCGVGCQKTYGQNNWALEVSSTQGLVLDKIDLPVGIKLASNAVKYSKSYGYSVQVGFLYQQSPKWQLSSGLRIANMGNSYETSVLNLSGQVQNIKEDVSLNYFQIPLAVRFQVYDKEKLKVFTSLGFYVGYLLNAKRDFQSNNYSEVLNNSNLRFSVVNETTGSKSDFNFTLESNPYHRIDFGPLVQTGICYQWSSKILIPISLNMSYGLNKIQNDKALYNKVNAPSELFWVDGVFNNSTHNFFTGLSVGVIYYLE